MRPVSMCTFWGTLVFLLGANPLVTSGQSDQKTVTPKQNDEILQRFVKECISIEPGHDPFPKDFQMGGMSEGPFSQPPRMIAMAAKFRVSRYEVTQELYETVTGLNPSRWKGPRNSVEMVSFRDAEKFCSQLTVLLQSKKMIAENEFVRLPTEAEWEYCCRAGTQTRYSFGDSATAEKDQGPQASVLDDFAWHTGNAAGNDPVVGSLKPNPWGLFDMHGYLWEFVSDPYTPPVGSLPAAAGTGADSAKEDPSAADSASRIIRGGSWRDPYSLLTSAYRLTVPGHAASDAIGLRCIIAESPQNK